MKQMFKYIIQTFDGRREWLKDPEMLQNCSIGLHYPPESEEILEVLANASLHIAYLRISLRSLKP